MIRFGTDGWRAIISQEFTFANVRIVAQAIAEYVLSTGEKDKGLIIGYDTRFLSPQYAEEVAKVMAANGIKVYLVKEAVPTPVISYAIVKKGAAGGVVITASHNPACYNGIKFKAPYGGSASPKIVQEIENNLARIENLGQAPLVLDYQLAVTKELINLFDPKPEYLEHLKSLVDLKRISQSKLKVVVDPMYGAGRNYLAEILGELGIEVKQIHAEINPGFAGINPEPILRNLGDLVKTVQREKADLGLATDGDADRIGAVDHQGEFVDSHRIFALLLDHLVRERKWSGEVVKTFSVSKMIEYLVKKYNLVLRETPIGFKYICDLIQQRDVLIGGEESGGIGVKGHLPERDGILCSLLLLEVIAAQQKPLQQIIIDLMEEIGYHYYDREDLHLTLAQKENLLAILKNNPPKLLGNLEVLEIKDLDGIKFLMSDGSWILFRPSGTEPVVRIYAEADSKEKVDCLLKAGCGLIR